jgi:hypothetical protein
MGEGGLDPWPPFQYCTLINSGRRLLLPHLLIAWGLIPDVCTIASQDMSAKEYGQERRMMKNAFSDKTQNGTRAFT